jgi:micrococcal nuclease
LLAFILAAAYFFQSPGGRDKEGGKYFVKRVIDGDTILLATGEKVRYIGIDTPETKHPSKGVEFYGREAAAFNKQLVEGKWVTLEFDIERRDRYNRLLAYVYADGLFVNAALVEEGYAQIYTFPPNVKHAELFIRLQREARADERGLWGRRLDNTP